MGSPAVAVPAGVLGRGVIAMLAAIMRVRMSAARCARFPHDEGQQFALGPEHPQAEGDDQDAHAEREIRLASATAKAASRMAALPV
jgi:hypothetical protein